MQLQEIEKLREQALKKYFRSLKAKDLLKAFQEYLEEEKKLIFLEWQQKKSPDEWLYLKAKLEVLQEIEKMLENEAKNVIFFSKEVEELEKIKEEG